MRLAAAPGDLVVARSGARLHPTFGRWPASLVPALNAYMAEGQRKLQNFMEQQTLTAVDWPVEPFDPFFNVNTPLDLAVAEMIAATGTAPVLLDAEGLKCPLPALKTGRALDALAQGQALLVSATDPLAIVDIPHLVAQRGDILLAQAQDKRNLRFLIRHSH